MRDRDKSDFQNYPIILFKILNFQQQKYYEMGKETGNYDT